MSAYAPYFFAQPQLNTDYAGSAPAPPPGFTYLNRGCLGLIYVSTNGTTVLKVLLSSKPSEAQIKECELLQILASCATDYAPGPVTSTRVTLQGREFLALRMFNAGNAMSVLGNSYQLMLPAEQRLAPLAPEELALCMLQSIHCVLLVNDRLLMKDVHQGNMCVQWRGPLIRLRFIDVGLWSKDGGSIVSNAYTLFWGMWNFWGKVWGTEFIQESSLVLDLREILQKGITEFQTKTLSRRNVYAELLLLANDIQKTFFSHVERSKVTQEYYIRVYTLIESIHNASLLAVLHLSQQPM